MYQRREKRFCSLGKRKDQLIRPKRGSCGPSKGDMHSKCMDELGYSNSVCETPEEGKRVEEGASFSFLPKDNFLRVSKRCKKQ